MTIYGSFLDNAKVLLDFTISSTQHPTSNYHLKVTSDRYIIHIVITVILIFAAAGHAQTPVCLQSASTSEDGDRWFGEDKFYHFTVSAGIAAGSYYVYREQLHNRETGSYYFSGGFTLSLGALKEFYDAKHPDQHTASWKDFAADAAGMGVGLLIGYLVVE